MVVRKRFRLRKWSLISAYPWVDKSIPRSIYGKRGKVTYMKINHSFFFFSFIISFSHRTHRNTAGSEFKNPTRLDKRQICDYAGISNPTSITLLKQYSHFAHKWRDRHNEEAQRWHFKKPTKSKPKWLWENQGWLSIPHQSRSWTPQEDLRVYRVEIRCLFKKM